MSSAPMRSAEQLLFEAELAAGRARADARASLAIGRSFERQHALYRAFAASGVSVRQATASIALLARAGTPAAQAADDLRRHIGGC